MNRRLVFPTLAEELTAELLTEALPVRHPDVRVDAVNVVDQAHCMSGSASTAARALLDLSYARGCDQGLPSRLILKTVLIRPGSIPDLYENEVRFYARLRDELSIETPRAYASTFDAASGTFGVLMEDLTLRAARFPNAIGAMSHEEITSLLGQLADLHAQFWCSPRFERDLAWLWTPRSGGFYDFLQALGLRFFRGLLDESEYKRQLLVRLDCSLERLWELLWKAQDILNTGPATLLHGDTHLGNTYLLPGGRAGVLDWQLMNKGRWPHDVTYILTTALDTPYRREHERELLGCYLERLRAAGVEVPSFEQAWLLYRQSAMWGFMLGWFICPVANYGETILRANLERLVAALEDLETFKALDR